MDIDFLGIVCLIIVMMSFISAVVEAQDKCDGQENCVKCNQEGKCVKCVDVIMYESRDCLEACPSGYRVEWSTSVDYMGRVCRSSGGILDSVGLTGKELAILVGACGGGAICIGILIGSLLYLKRKRKKDPYFNSDVESSYTGSRRGHSNKAFAESEEQAAERKQFLQQLADLKPEAQNFLEMLNETRNKFRRLGGSEARSDSKAKAYRAVLRDLSRVLTLLNRKDESIMTIPSDWRRMLSWAERVLRRYKRQKAAKENNETPSMEYIQNGSGPSSLSKKKADNALHTSSEMPFIKNERRSSKFSITRVILEESEEGTSTNTAEIINTHKGILKNSNDSSENTSDSGTLSDSRPLVGPTKEIEGRPAEQLPMQSNSQLSRLRPQNEMVTEL